uniref:Hint domain-containing protein n=1 Tax=Timspurckia oligopyrenoides TaxID=708627 RepID=A0A7S0ZBP6_9RHOD|mmetsp:Transcript_11479/g.20758  ORF Transcript_11479/g.20758 Transcript_11479/m.20758 type:complete len:418 (+) Transcript_11479:88-1341(+)
MEFKLFLSIIVIVLKCASGDAVDLSSINGIYKTNDTYSVGVNQSILCSDEIWLASSRNSIPLSSKLLQSLDGSSTQLTAELIVVEADGELDFCSGGYYEIDSSQNFTYHQTISNISVETFAESGFFGRMPVGTNITCGYRRMLSSIELPGIFLFLERGVVQLSDLNTGVVNTYGISEKTAAFIGEMQFLGELKQEQICLHTYDRPLIPEEDNGGTAACFPSNAMVKMVDGSEKRMSELKIGDSVKTRNGVDEVFMFTHKVESRLAEFIQLKVDKNRFIRLSTTHLIVLDNNGKNVLVAADDVKVGDFLMFMHEERRMERVQVIEKLIVKDIGVFHPHTLNGELIVNGFVVSSYSTLLTPSVCNVLVLPAKLLYLVFNTRNSVVNSMLSVFNTDQAPFLHCLLAFINKLARISASESS